MKTDFFFRCEKCNRVIAVPPETILEYISRLKREVICLTEELKENYQKFQEKQSHKAK